jgi:hypothetical protein
VLGYGEGVVRFVNKDGRTNSLPIQGVRRIDIDRTVPAAPAAAPPAAPEPVARAVKGDELRQNSNKCYIVFSHPPTDKYGTVWIHLRRKSEYEEKKGLFNVSGTRYDPVVSTIFDRNGQMFFEAEPGKYEVSLSLEPDGGRQLRKTGKMELKAGEMMDYSFPAR